MSYFNDLDFVASGDQPDYVSCFRDKEFPDYYGIQYNHSGICRLQVDGGEEILLGGGTGFFTAPGRKFTYGATPGKSRHHMYVCFRGERVRAFIAGGLFAPYAAPPVFRLRDPEQFFREMLELHNLLRYPAAFRAQRRIHLLEGVLLRIAEQPQGENGLNPFLLDSIDALRRRIVENPQLAWDFEEEARKMSVSYPHFRRIFRRATEFAPAHFLIECRLNRASQLLLESNLPINEIARRCGYQDEFYFSRLFRRYRFCTASAYRKKFGS